MSILRLENICKTYDGGVEVLKDVSFEVQPGQTMVLAGSSGIGKTTILRIIAGLDQPTSGHVYIDGKCVNDTEPKDRQIAMVFQHYSLYPHMTVFENMGFALKMQKTPKDVIRQKVTEAAGMLGLEDLLSRKPFQLSGGQRQRVALGKAIVRQPKLFLFDEPLSNLDFTLRESIRTQIKQTLKKLNATAVYVTHDPTEAQYLADITYELK